MFVSSGADLAISYFFCGSDYLPRISFEILTLQGCI